MKKKKRCELMEIKSTTLKINVPVSQKFRIKKSSSSGGVNLISHVEEFG